MWKVYQNLNGNSGIEKYEIHEKSQKISVKFIESEREYTYSASKIGDMHYRNMINCALLGHGLNAYIMNHKDVAKGYDK